MAVFGMGPGLDHPGGEEGDSRRPGPLGLGEPVDERLGLVPRHRTRFGLSQHLLEDLYRRPERGECVLGLAREGARGHDVTIERGCDTAEKEGERAVE